MVLTSGASSQFGCPKMLHALDEGTNILASTIGIYANVCEVVNVVVREGDHEVMALADSDVAVNIVNPELILLNY